MKQYSIELDETVSEFFLEIALIAKRPIEELLSDALFKQVEIIKRRIAESFEVEEN